MPIVAPINNNFYQIYPQFLASNLTYILPPSFSYNVDQVLQIPNVYGQVNPIGNANAVIKLDASSAGQVNTDFSLSWVAGASVTNNVGVAEPTAIAQVTIKATNVWRTDDVARQQLKTSLAVFYQKLEDLELKIGCLCPGGAFSIWQRVIETLPLSIKEVLAYRYNFSSSNRYIDLQAGMQLRIEFANQQFISPSSEQNGFVGSGSSYYEVCRVTDSSGKQKLAFDSFLGTIGALNILPPTGGIASLIDLQAAGNARRYWRLFYPPQMPSNTGNSSISQNVTLIGADTLNALNAATSAYLASGDTATVTDGSLPILYFFFRGRTVIIPQVLVFLDDNPCYVPIGTTVRNLMDRCLNSSFLSRSSTTGINNLSMKFGRTWTDNSGNVAYKSAQFLMLSKDAPLSTPDAYDLPLVKGDVFSINNSL